MARSSSVYAKEVPMARRNEDRRGVRHGKAHQVRCAVYTRKSTDEGLDQDFNSLDAQREACEAFIQSQRSEGWALVPEAYDDGGISGGTLQRPALQRLIADIGRAKFRVWQFKKLPIRHHSRATGTLVHLVLTAALSRAPDTKGSGAQFLA
jgi:hypothetical protein